MNYKLIIIHIPSKGWHLEKQIDDKSLPLSEDEVTLILSFLNEYKFELSEMTWQV
jgi:hypothetical protein